MAKGKTKLSTKLKKMKKHLPVLCLSAALLFTVGMLVGGGMGRGELPTPGALLQKVASFFEGLLPTSLPTIAPPADGQVEVHAIDVGQGNSFLIKTGSSTVLIDAGENDQGDTVLSYLKSAGVTRLDLVIGTHPHSDHIGGLDYILSHVPADRVILPKIPDSLLPTTRTYRDLLDIIGEKGLQITPAKPGAQFDLGGATLTLLAPAGENFTDLNDYSVVARLDGGGSSFLFTGDCTAAGESALLEDGQNPDVDILFVGHHGSSTSSGKTFLKAVSPMASLISVGADNSYGHPHPEVVERLTGYGPIYRTDLLGSLTVTAKDGTVTLTGGKAPGQTFSLKEGVTE